MLSLILSLMTIILNWDPIQAYASFSLVFHKEGKNSYFTFQLVLFTIGILLPLFMLKKMIVISFV